MGWGIIEGQKDEWRHIAHGCIETSPQQSLQERLLVISKCMNVLLEKFEPDKAGVEELFFTKNVTTGLQVAHARGIVLVEFAKRNIPTVEIKPNQIKMSVTGDGSADKIQVQKMVCMHLGVKDQRIQDDAADALAVALACRNST